MLGCTVFPSSLADLRHFVNERFVLWRAIDLSVNEKLRVSIE